jgi:hypothetical protein
MSYATKPRSKATGGEDRKHKPIAVLLKNELLYFNTSSKKVSLF